MVNEDIAFFCKSFRDDLAISLRMAESVLTQSSGIPLVISVPQRDFIQFRAAHDRSVEVVEDEALVGHAYPDGWLFQQGVKLHAHRLGIADNYVMLDSDFLIFRSVDVSDFVSPSGRGFFVATSHAYTFTRSDRWLSARLLGDASLPEFDGVSVPLDDGSSVLTVEQLEAVADGFEASVKNEESIRATFGVPGKPVRGFMPAPILNSSVLTELESFASHLPEGVLTLVKKSPWEYSWYGEFALASGDASRRERVEPGVFCLTDSSQLDLLQESGITLASMSRNFFGVSLAARHMEEGASISARDFQSRFSFGEK